MKNEYFFPSVYSSEENMLFIIYCYPEYGDVNISFEITSTHCKPILLSMCENGEERPEPEMVLYSDYNFDIPMGQYSVLTLSDYQLMNRYVEHSVSIRLPGRKEPPVYKKIMYKEPFVKCEMDIKGNFKSRKGVVEHYKVKRFLRGLFSRFPRCLLSGFSSPQPDNF